ncbi:MAG: transcription antitermination factor NusB [Clostridia bacterium]|nr:transcription antitermination factor NusB [Clostridia bacterium]MBQ5957501.1 transcription antitermination factor NusB [Clostridia bacterium]MBQ6004465.1 transcription antitermination factor NusB [Clostridia bacterium]MBR0437957.1 transcription antitermination factor NusB [Clostridia bacterium]MBR3563184.1 transcription antitermination factor NusB [Clostridia bacterium]
MSETVNFDKRLAREAAMSLYYERTIRGEPVNDSTTLIDFEDVLDRARLNEDNLKYIDCAMEIYEEHIDDIDASIRSHLNRWTIDRISKVNLSILRLAVAEMKYMDDITPGVSVNEAVELTKKYSDEESSGFVNGILRSISRDIK